MGSNEKIVAAVRSLVEKSNIIEFCAVIHRECHLWELEHVVPIRNAETVFASKEQLHSIMSKLQCALNNALEPLSRDPSCIYAELERCTGAHLLSVMAALSDPQKTAALGLGSFAPILLPETAELIVKDACTAFSICCEVEPKSGKFEVAQAALRILDSVFRANVRLTELPKRILQQLLAGVLVAVSKPDLLTVALMPTSPVFFALTVAGNYAMRAGTNMVLDLTSLCCDSISMAAGAMKLAAQQYAAPLKEKAPLPAQSGAPTPSSPGQDDPSPAISNLVLTVKQCVAQIGQLLPTIREDGAIVRSIFEAKQLLSSVQAIIVSLHISAAGHLEVKRSLELIPSISRLFAVVEAPSTQAGGDKPIPSPKMKPLQNPASLLAGFGEVRLKKNVKISTRLKSLIFGQDPPREPPKTPKHTDPSAAPSAFLGSSTPQMPSAVFEWLVAMIGKLHLVDSELFIHRFIASALGTSRDSFERVRGSARLPELLKALPSVAEPTQIAILELLEKIYVRLRCIPGDEVTQLISLLFASRSCALLTSGMRLLSELLRIDALSNEKIACVEPFLIHVLHFAGTDTDYATPCNYNSKMWPQEKFVALMSATISCYQELVINDSQCADRIVQHLFELLDMDEPTLQRAAEEGIKISIVFDPVEAHGAEIVEKYLKRPMARRRSANVCRILAGAAIGRNVPPAPTLYTWFTAVVTQALDDAVKLGDSAFDSAFDSTCPCWEEAFHAALTSMADISVVFATRVYRDVDKFLRIIAARIEEIRDDDVLGFIAQCIIDTLTVTPFANFSPLQLRGAVSCEELGHRQSMSAVNSCFFHSVREGVVRCSAFLDLIPSLAHCAYFASFRATVRDALKRATDLYAPKLYAWSLDREELQLLSRLAVPSAVAMRFPLDQTYSSQLAWNSILIAAADSPVPAIEFGPDGGMAFQLTTTKKEFTIAAWVMFRSVEPPKDPNANIQFLSSSLPLFALRDGAGFLTSLDFEDDALVVSSDSWESRRVIVNKRPVDKVVSGRWFQVLWALSDTQGTKVYINGVLCGASDAIPKLGSEPALECLVGFHIRNVKGCLFSLGPVDVWHCVLSEPAAVSAFVRETSSQGPNPFRYSEAGLRLLSTSPSTRKDESLAERPPRAAHFNPRFFRYTALINIERSENVKGLAVGDAELFGPHSPLRDEYVNAFAAFVARGGLGALVGWIQDLAADVSIDSVLKIIRRVLRKLPTVTSMTMLVNWYVQLDHALKPHAFNITTSGATNLVKCGVEIDSTDNVIVVDVKWFEHVIADMGLLSGFRLAPALAILGILATCFDTEKNKTHAKRNADFISSTLFFECLSHNLVRYAGRLCPQTIDAGLTVLFKLLLASAPGVQQHYVQTLFVLSAHLVPSFISPSGELHGHLNCPLPPFHVLSYLSNSLLRVMHSMLDVVEVATVLGEQMDPTWVIALTEPRCHSITALFSTAIFCRVLPGNAPLRANLEKNPRHLAALVHNLSAHAANSAIALQLLAGFLGFPLNITTTTQTEIEDQIVLRVDSSKPLTPQPAAAPLLMGVLTSSVQASSKRDFPVHGSEIPSVYFAKWKRLSWRWVRLLCVLTAAVRIKRWKQFKGAPDANKTPATKAVTPAEALSLFVLRLLERVIVRPGIFAAFSASPIALHFMAQYVQWIEEDPEPRSPSPIFSIDPPPPSVDEVSLSPEARPEPLIEDLGLSTNVEESAPEPLAVDIEEEPELKALAFERSCASLFLESESPAASLLTSDEAEVSTAVRNAAVSALRALIFASATATKDQSPSMLAVEGPATLWLSLEAYCTLEGEDRTKLRKTIVDAIHTAIIDRTPPGASATDPHPVRCVSDFTRQLVDRFIVGALSFPEFAHVIALMLRRCRASALSTAVRREASFGIVVQLLESDAEQQQWEAPCLSLALQCLDPLYLHVDFVAQVLSISFARILSEQTAENKKLHDNAALLLRSVFRTYGQNLKSMLTTSRGLLGNMDVYTGGFNLMLRDDTEEFFKWYRAHQKDADAPLGRLARTVRDARKSAQQRIKELVSMLTQIKGHAEFTAMQNEKVFWGSLANPAGVSNNSSLARPNNYQGTFIRTTGWSTIPATSLQWIRGREAVMPPPNTAGSRLEHYLDVNGFAIPFVCEANDFIEPSVCDEHVTVLQYLLPQFVCPLPPFRGGAMQNFIREEIRDKLAPSAIALLRRLVSGLEEIQFVSNAIKIDGLMTIPVLLVLTNKLLRLFSGGQLLENGIILLGLDPTESSSSATVMKKKKSYRLQLQSLTTLTGNESIFSRLSQSVFSILGAKPPTDPALGKIHMQGIRAVQDITRSTSGPGLPGIETLLTWQYPLITLTDIKTRTFQHEDTALELHFDLDTPVFLAVLNSASSLTEEARDRLLASLKSAVPIATVTTAATRKNTLEVTSRLWEWRLISNFEYITLLNDAAGRTTRDLTQYPVFPWVLADYSSSQLDTTKSESYRDLAKPIGAQRADRAEEVQHRFEAWPVDGTTPFHFGSHYSTCSSVLWYLIRIQPFTRMAIQFHGGRLDVADRLFHSIKETYEGCTSNSADCRELVPELYFCPAVLRNISSTTFGTRQSGEEVHHVILPPWARNEEEFVQCMRTALESEHVSAGLPAWIDLIFGEKQRGESAKRALNVYHPLTYNDFVLNALRTAETREDRIAIVAQVANFGQTPRQLFVREHFARQPNKFRSRVTLFASHFASGKLDRKEIAVMLPVPPSGAAAKGMQNRALTQIVVRQSSSDLYVSSSSGELIQSVFIAASWANCFLVGANSETYIYFDEYNICRRATKDGTLLKEQFHFIPPCGSRITAVYFGQREAVGFIGTFSGAIYVLCRNPLSHKMEHRFTLLGHRSPIRKISPIGRHFNIVTTTTFADDPPIVWRVMRQRIVYVHRLDVVGGTLTPTSTGSFMGVSNLAVGGPTFLGSICGSLGLVAQFDPPTSGDPVMDVSIDNRDRRYLVVTSRLLNVFSFGGTMLGSIDFPPELPNAVCCTVLSFPESHDGMTLVATGHLRTIICLWWLRPSPRNEGMKPSSSAGSLAAAFLGGDRDRSMSTTPVPERRTPSPLPPHIISSSVSSKDAILAFSLVGMVSAEAAPGPAGAPRIHEPAITQLHFIQKHLALLAGQSDGRLKLLQIKQTELEEIDAQYGSLRRQDTTQNINPSR